MSDQNLTKLTKATYLKMIENSIGSKMFRSFYVKNEKTGEVVDVCKNGELSCAFYVGSILTILGLEDYPHMVVETAVKELEKRGWEERDAENLLPGDILVWLENEYVKGHEHIGFYIGNDTAVSNHSKSGEVISHHINNRNNEGSISKAEIVKVLRYPGF